MPTAEAAPRYYLTLTLSSDQSKVFTLRHWLDGVMKWMRWTDSQNASPIAFFVTKEAAEREAATHEAHAKHLRASVEIREAA